MFSTTACDSVGAEGDRGDEEPVEEISEVSEEEAVTTMIQILIDRGLVEDSSSEEKTSSSSRTKMVPDPVLDALGAKDYVSIRFVESARSDDERETLMMSLWVDPDGELIPNGEWRDAHPKACDGRLRYLKGAAHLLNFKIHPSNRQVTAQFISVETGKIEKEKTAESDEDNWLRDAIEDAWNQLNMRIEKAEDPCGARMRLDLIFGSVINEEYTSGDDLYTTTYEVTLEAELDYVDVIELSDEEEDWYEGYGTLVYEEFTSSEYGTCTVPDGGRWGTFELIIPERAEDPVSAIEMRMDDGGDEEATPVECSAVDDDHLIPITWGIDFAMLHENELRPGPLHYLIRNWEAVPGDSDVIARKVYDQTVTHHDEDSTLILTEQTKIELRRRAE